MSKIFYQRCKHFSTVPKKQDPEYLNYQFLQLSKIPTLHFQKSLPRLPIPKLDLTCERYLAAQKPLLIEEAYRKTEHNMKRFADANGQQLNDYLKEYDKNNKHTSYISDMWFDMYLKDRNSLPLNYNPILVMPKDENKEYNDQLIRATNMVISSLRFYKSLSTSILAPEVFHLNPKKSDTDFFTNVCGTLPPSLSWYGAYLFKAYPLDMSQYSKLFNSTRIPETDKDRLYSTVGSTHITVQHKGHFYVLNVMSKEQDILPPEEILDKLNMILNDDVNEAEFPIGIFTALDRNKWATFRHKLLDLGNDTKLKLIDSALFNLCLDHDVISDDPYKIARHYLHSDAKNRWFDKSFSLIITKDGHAGLNFEHAWGDGVAILRYVQDIFKDTTKNPQVSSDMKPSNKDINDVYRLELNLNEYLKEEIKYSLEHYKKTCELLDVNYMIFDGIGKTICKNQSISPDAIMQLGFQIAYHKLMGKFVSTYESCSTAAFKHGRTEAIRPCTMATKDFVLAINSKTVETSKQDLKRMLLECSKVHGQLTREAAMGQGFDRHLFALKHFANIHNISCHIFEDPEYHNINHNILSTSTLNSPAVMAGGFGPVCEDGFGIGYVIRDNELGVMVTNNSLHSDGKGFIEALKPSFDEILEVLKH